MIVNSYIPKELVNIILEYDGNIKYRKGKYINIIHKNDVRRKIVSHIISKKIRIINNILFDNLDFYFEVGFDMDNTFGLYFDYNYSFDNKFEICYFDIRNSWKTIKTYL